MIYRRRVLSDTWHFLPECSKWPKDCLWGKFKERSTPPATGFLCQQCLSKYLNKQKKEKASERL